MANNDQMNLTFYFDYKSNEAGLKEVMSSLDKLEIRAEEAMRLNPQGLNSDDLERNIERYRLMVERMRDAINNVWDIDKKGFNLDDIWEYDPSLATAFEKGLGGVSTNIRQVDRDIETSGVTIGNYTERLDNFKTSLVNAFRYNVVNNFIDLLMGQVQGLTNYIRELDTALNDIRIVTGKTADEMLDWSEKSIAAAENLGRSATEYAKAALIYYQQGLPDDQITDRTNATLKLANVSKQSVEEVADQLTAIWNNFDDGSKSMEYYADVITKLGADTASSSDEIATGIQKFASVAQTIGLSYEYATAALTTITATTRESAEVVGTALKTIFSRFQGLKLGETLDDGTTLNQYSEALGKIGVNILDDNGNLKEMDEIIDDIGAKWKTLTKAQQMATAETVAGTRQYTQMTALFANFDFFKQNVESAKSSLGALNEQNEIYLDSIDAKLDQLSATADSIKFDLFMGTDWGTAIDALNTILKGTRGLIDDFGGLSGILVTTGALLTKTFAPKLITDFATKTSKMINDWNKLDKKVFTNLSSLNAGSFKDTTSTINFFTNALVYGSEEYKENIRIANSILSTGGKEAAETYEQMSGTIQEIVLYLERTTENTLGRFSKRNSRSGGLNLFEQGLALNDSDAKFKSLNSDQQDVLTDSLIKTYDALGLTQKAQDQLFAKYEQYTSKNLNTNQIFELSIQDIANALIQEGSSSEEVAKKLNVLNQTTNKLLKDNKAYAKAQETQTFIKGISAATVAVQGLFTVLQKGTEGDYLGALSSGLMSAGMAVSMFNPLIGGTITLVGTIASGIGTALDQAKEKQREAVETALETSKTYSDSVKTLDSSINTYQKLSQQTSLTDEEQQKLNSAISQFQNIIGTDDDFIAYYDEKGNAVYKTAEQVQKLIDKWKEEKEAAISAAKESSKSLAQDNLDDYQKQVDKMYEYRTKKDNTEQAKAILNSAKNQNRALTGQERAKISGLTGLADLGTTDAIEKHVNELINHIDIELDNAKKAIGEDWTDLDNYIQTVISGETLNYDDKNYAKLGSYIEESFKDAFNKGIIDAENFQTKFEQLIPQIFGAINDPKNQIDIDKLLSGDKDTAQKFENILKNLVENNPELKDMEDILDTMIDSWEGNADAANEAADAAYNFAGTVSNWDSQLSGFKDVIDEAQSALEEFSEKGSLSYDTMVALNSAFGDISGYEEFANQLANGSMTAEQFKEGIEQLVSTYYTEKVALEGVTDENKAQLEMMLRSLGITNASQVANASLAKEIYAQGNAAIAAGEDSSKYEAALKEMGYGAIFADKATYELKLQMIAANETNMSFDEQIAAIEALGNKAIESGYKIKFMINSANAASKVKNLAGALQRTGLSAEEAYNQAQQSILNSMQSEFEKGLKDYEFKMPDIDLGSYGSGSRGGGGGGSSSKEKDYEATIDKYEKKTKAIEELEREILDLNNEVSDTESLLEKNDLLEKTNKLLKQEKELQLDLNNARDKEIAQNVQQLKSIGFDIEYDPEQDKLLINNKEHINDLTATGDKTTSEYRKEIEGLIKDTESLNDSNQDAVDKFKELNRQIEKNNKAIKENAYNDFKNQQDDILFNTIFYENLESGTSKVREIYLMVFNNWQAKLDEMIAKGMTLADDEVQEAIKKLYDLQDKIDDASDKIYENQKDRIDDLLDFFSTASPKAISLVGKKIDLTNQQIAENLEKGTEESINKAIELYQELWKYQKQALELQKELLEQQKDDYDDVISAVTGAIDKEIDKLKEEQEALKEQNEEREKEIELMKLKAALELAQSQKTILVYHKNKGFVWEADQEAIDEAKKNLNEFYADQEQDEIQKRIDALEKYKNKWSSIPDDIEQAENEIKAAEILGSDWQSKIFNMREDVVAEFGKNYKTTYDGIKQLDEQINNGYTPIVEKIEELIAKLAELQQQAEETAKSLNFDIENSQHYYANANGQAPTGLKTGDTVTTMGGTYVISTTEQEGWGYNKESGYWSKLLGATEEIQKRLAAQDSARLNGSQVMQPEILEVITEALQEEMPELLNATNEGLSSTSSELKTLNEISLDKISTDFKNYSSSIEKAINNTDASAKNAKASASWASDSASDAARSASDAQKYAEDAAQSARDAARSASDAASSASSSVEVHHRGTDSGLAGSPTKVKNNLFELANGGLKSDEVLSVLQKGEAIFTSQQLATLGQSVNSLILLNDLQQKQIQFGITQGFNNNVNSIKPQEGNNISFGDININITGVENQEQFSSALKNNIKSIFAQAVAGI